MIETKVATPRASASRRATADSRLRAILLPIVGLAIVIAFWWLSVLVFDIQEAVLPTPGQVVTAFVTQPREILDGTWTTTEEVLVGFGIAIVVGLLIAFVLTSSRTLNQMFYPLVVAANAIPKVAVAPLLTVSVGLGVTSKTIVVFLVSFFPIVVAAHAGFRSTPAEFAELARALSASRLQTFVKVRFPGALPQIFVGLKVAAPLAVVGAVVGEFGGALRGLAQELFAYGGQGRTAEGFAAVFLLSILALVLFYLVVLAERLVVPWASRTSG
jgi:NitT/TauT family transport system permease protein